MRGVMLLMRSKCWGGGSRDRTAVAGFDPHPFEEITVLQGSRGVDQDHRQPPVVESTGDAA
jgi:hypothetical protein